MKTNIRFSLDERKEIKKNLDKGYSLSLISAFEEYVNFFTEIYNHRSFNKITPDI